MKKIIRRMKRALLVFIFSISCTLVFAQQSIFEKYEDFKDVTTVYFSKTMLGMMDAASGKNQAITKIAKKLQKLQILECENASLIEKIKQESEKYYRANRYEIVMQVRNDGEHVTIFERKKGRSIPAFALLTSSKRELSIIYVEGNIRLEDIKALAN
ncbi:MAG: DUF4252 domain-containing protein [Prevotella sp.]|nr:DUF4252 domain-containing protein [Prevotella sp.]MDD7273021.1 DUF4252 domain-containing protein [Prevotellaceae bacterium]MDY3935686.1 DUF4252 domain-containing protein [Prevotella sp.]MDY4217826.1 DUF4252 domain-containing protein [Prevotella sp.]